MTILIVAATKEEILPSIPLMEKLEIPYLITGVGMIATSYHTGRCLLKNKYDLIVNIGIAGTFDYHTPLGTVVYIAKDTLTELGAQDGPQFLSITELGFGQNTWEGSIPPNIKVNLPYVEAITVNTVHGNESSIREIRKRMPQVTVESMEGAAVYYVAAMENTAAIQVRAISNYVEKRNRAAWNIPLAIQNLHIWLQDFIENLS